MWHVYATQVSKRLAIDTNDNTPTVIFSKDIVQRSLVTFRLAVIGSCDACLNPIRFNREFSVIRSDGDASLVDPVLVLVPDQRPAEIINLTIEVNANKLEVKVIGHPSNHIWWVANVKEIA